MYIFYLSITEFLILYASVLFVLAEMPIFKIGTLQLDTGTSWSPMRPDRPAQTRPSGARPFPTPQAPESAPSVVQ